MAKAEATVAELVGMIERGELRLLEMQRRYVWQAARVWYLLSDKAPSDYFAKLLGKNGEAALVPQCIPTEANLLGVDQYKDFLVERRRPIAARLNAFLGA